MSYAEYGSRIFYNHSSDTKLSLRQGDVLPDKYLGYRLRKQESCIDVRAWSLNQLDYCQYFRELTEHGPWLVKTIPNKTTLGAVEVSNKEEIEYLRRELAKYKSLKLTSEQKKQLGHSDLWEVLSKEGWNLFESFLNQIEKIKSCKEVLLERAFPGSFIQTEEIHDDKVKLKQFDNEFQPMKRKLMNDGDRGRNTTESQSSTRNNKQETDKNDTNYTSSDQSDNSSDCYVKSKSTTLNYNDDDIDNINSIRDSQTEVNSTDSEHDHIIKEKDAEIEKFNKSNMKLRLIIEDRDIQIDNLQEKLSKTQCQLRDIKDQHNFEVDELKIKLANGKNLIDQLKRKLEEQRLQYNIQMAAIENLKYDTRSIETLRNERDLLASKLDKVLKNVNGFEVHESIETWIYERKALKEENQKLEQQCLELEKEIIRLLNLNDENNTQCFKMEQIIEDLRNEIAGKNQQIDNYNHKLSTLMKETEEKFFNYENSFGHDDLTDVNLDQRLGLYLKKKVDNIKDFSYRLEDAWNYVERRKIEYDDLRKKLVENERTLELKLNEKCKEVEYFNKKCEEYRDLIGNQAKEIENLRKAEYPCGTDEKFNYLSETIEEMNLKLINLQAENSELIDENKSLHSQIQKATDQLTILHNEKEKLLHEVKSMNVQLDDKSARVNALKNENLQLAQTLADTNNKLETIFTKSNSMKLEIDKVNSLLRLQKEIIKDDNEKRELKETIAHLYHEHGSYQQKNKRLEDNLINTSNQKVLLENKLSAIKKDISELLNNYEEIMHQNNIYSNVDLMHLSKKLSANIKALQQRFSLSDLITPSKKESTDHSDEQYGNHDNEEINSKSHPRQMNEIDQNIDNNYNCDELKSKDLIISLKEDYHKLSLKLNSERIMYESKLAELQQNKMAYEDHNEIMKRLKNQCGAIDDSYNSSLNISGYDNINIDNKNKNSNKSDNDEQNTRISTLLNFKSIDPILEKNIDDFSKIKEQYHNTAINNCRIFFPHNGKNRHIKSKQRYTHEELMRPDNTSCQKFIRSCSERRNHVNY